MNRTLVKKHIALPAQRFSFPGKIRRLASSGCPVFFPADVFIQEETVHIFFRTEGYRPLKDCRNLTAVQCLEILKELARHLGTARDWMWYAQDLVISPDTVWIDGSGHLRLLCIPDSRKIDVSRRLSSFFCSLKKLTDEEGRKALTSLQQEWLNCQWSWHRMIGTAERMILELKEYSSYHFI